MEINFNLTPGIQVMTQFSIEENRLSDVMEILPFIPEFTKTPSYEDIQVRLCDVPYLVLTAYQDQRPVGFKIGYERDKAFYSWLGAIHPGYRRLGIASALADYQEKRAKEIGFTSIWMKTRNCFPEMLMMAFSRGFTIIGFDPQDDLNQHRIILAKSL